MTQNTTTNGTKLTVKNIQIIESHRIRHHLSFVEAEKNIQKYHLEWLEE